jgi:sugar phosphate isomerase/epimerase
VPERKIGIQLASLRLPFKEALLTAARLGAAAVEFDGRSEIRPGELSQTGLRQLRKMLDDLNLRVCAVAFRTRRGYDVPEELEPRLDATRKAMKLAYDLGAGVVINHVGHIPESAGDPAWSVLVESLADLGKHGHHVGALLAADTGTESGADMARLLAALPTGAVGVNLNPGNLLVNGFSPSEAVAVLGDHILHVHATDGVRDRGQGRGVEVPLGRGSVDFPALCGQLEVRGYRGYFTIERRGAADPLAQVGHPVKYLQSL